MIHEIGHSLGLGHEQKRPDRDSFIQMHWENIPSDWVAQYVAYSNADTGRPYNYNSLMHYSAGACDNPLPGPFRSLCNRVQTAPHHRPPIV